MCIYRCDCGEPLCSTPSQVSALNSAPSQQSSAWQLLTVLRPALLLGRVLVPLIGCCHGWWGAHRGGHVGGGWAGCHPSAGAKGLTQGEASQVLDVGAADFTAGCRSCIAATARTLQALELIEEKGGVGRILGGTVELIHYISVKKTYHLFIYTMFLNGL